MEKRIIYCDNAATTPLSKTALDAMLPWLGTGYGNPSSIYAIAREARHAVETAREDVAGLLGAQSNEIYFTSGGTEADNWAIVGAASRAPETKRHIIVSAVEHHAVLEAARSLKGFEVTELPVDQYGRVSPADLRKTLREDTLLVSVMLANNEIGTIQPVRELAEIAHMHGALFHTDAVQAVGHIPVNVSDLGVDMLSLSAHKFHGPKGVGALFIRRGVRLAPLMHGGSHERGRRAGTENVAGIVGMTAALKEAVENMPERGERLCKVRDELAAKLLAIPYVQATGHPVERLPSLVSVVINGIEGESIILLLDGYGIMASSGSACTSGALDPSHVLLATGLPHATAHGSLRLSLPDDVTTDDIGYIAMAVMNVTERLRAMSPVWDSTKNVPLI